MIKNAVLKKILSNTVFKVVSLINRYIPKNQNMVLFYSNMGFRDNILYLYDYMVQEGYNEKYKIIRSQNEKYYGAIPENVCIISNIKAILYYLRAGHVFYAFGKLPIYPSNAQKVIQMWHGSPFKGADVRQRAEMTHDYRNSYYTNVFSTSEVFSRFWAEEFDCGIKRISICGHPRTDVMINQYSKSEMGLKNEKLIIWMPTFRQSKVLGYNDIVSSYRSLVPVVKDSELKKLNEALKQNNMKLMIKLHPLQDVDDFVYRDFSNIELLTHAIFLKKGFDLYRLLGSADALITDYSSVFYDFMLIDKPIAFTEDDMDDYKESRGFAVDNPDYYRAGHKIKTLNDLLNFINDVNDNNDPWREKRNMINVKVNKYRDFQNCKRALMISEIYK